MYHIRGCLFVLNCCQNILLQRRKILSGLSRQSSTGYPFKFASSFDSQYDEWNEYLGRHGGCCSRRKGSCTGTRATSLQTIHVQSVDGRQNLGSLTSLKLKTRSQYSTCALEADSLDECNFSTKEADPDRDSHWPKILFAMIMIQNVETFPWLEVRDTSHNFHLIYLFVLCPIVTIECDFQLNLSFRAVLASENSDHGSDSFDALSTEKWSTRQTLRTGNITLNNRNSASKKRPVKHESDREVTLIGKLHVP